MNQFFYTRKEPILAKEGEPQTFKEYTDSFNINKVIRSVEMEDKRLLILLDDIHERLQEMPIRNKSGKITYEMRRNVFQSEIYLEKEDAERFRKLGE